MANKTADSSQDIAAYVNELGANARAAASAVAECSTEEKNAALKAMAQALALARSSIKAANQLDCEAGEQKGLDAAMLDRLTLNDERLAAMQAGLQQVESLPDPIGSITDMEKQANGLQIGKMRVPIGVIGMVYESRPNVTVEAASLCLKAGNAVILRGGSEALHSNQAIADALREGLSKSSLPEAAVQLLGTPDRAAVGAMLAMDEYIDVMVPRGGKSLIQRVSDEAKMPVIKHLDGNCHVYIDIDAEMEMAQSIAVNAKTQRYGVCNAMETLLIHAAVAEQLLPGLVDSYRQHKVELRGCEQTQAIVAGLGAASEDDWFTEYLAPVLAIKVVADVEQAIKHINTYGSQHTDSIVTSNEVTAQRFLRAVDSSSVMVNASTRFADGFEYGLGAEIGISTDKLHARGPVGLHGLTSQKYVVFGEGQIRT